MSKRNEMQVWVPIKAKWAGQAKSGGGGEEDRWWRGKRSGEGVGYLWYWQKIARQRNGERYSRH